MKEWKLAGTTSSATRGSRGAAEPTRPTLCQRACAEGGVMALTDHACTCAACMAARGERPCPECGTVVPASWTRCWPCEQERQAGILAIQEYWTC